MLAKNIMHLVPIIPQPRVGVEESLEVARTAALKPVKPVEERTLPPLLNYAHELTSPAPTAINQHEKRQDTHSEDRRLVCRRFQHLPILAELRSVIDRRLHKQRSTDIRLHIDEEA